MERIPWKWNITIVCDGCDCIILCYVMVCYDCLFNGSIVGILLLLPIDRVPHKKWFAALTTRAAAAKNEMNVRMCTWSTLYVENNTHTMPLWNTVFAVAWMCKWNVERKKSAWNVHHAIHCHTAQNTIFHSMQMCLCLYVCVKDANRTTYKIIFPNWYWILSKWENLYDGSL